MKRVKLNGRRTDEFQKALDLADESKSEPQPGCRGREAEFVHYSSSPSKEEAEVLCADCPLKSVCRASALQERPAWGVQGGIAWDMGRQAHWVRLLKVSRENRRLTVDTLG